VSPLKKLTGKDIDYSIECGLEFGDFVQANEDNTLTNCMEARTFPAICLGPAKNLQGSYYFLNIQSWKILRRRSFTKMPISNENIQRINLKAGRDWELYGRQGLTFRFQEVDVNDFEEEGEAEDNREDDPAAPVANVEDVQPLPV
jgi:hypothetical protein